jgi:hypothetical protein
VTAYLMTWLPIIGQSPVDRQQILNVLDTIPEVANWRAAVGAIFIISPSSPTTLSEQIRRKLPGLHHVITRIDVFSMDGWADTETWSFVQYPRSRG